MRRQTKNCQLCESGIRQINFKDDKLLSRFVTDQGKIVPRRMSGTCSRHQRQMGSAIKRARYLALLPFIKGYEG